MSDWIRADDQLPQMLRSVVVETASGNWHIAFAASQTDGVRWHKARTGKQIREAISCWTPIPSTYPDA